MKRPRAPSLVKLAVEIERRFPELRAVVHPSWASTDRKVGRFRHPGKGRRGNELMVFAGQPAGTQSSRVVFRHNSAQTYRNNGEVVDWIVQRVARTVYFEITGVPRWDDDERRNAQ